MKREEIRTLVKSLTLEEKAALSSGAATFRAKGVERVGIPEIEMMDGPHGLRKQVGEQDFMGQNESIPATCFPAACAVGSSFDRELAAEVAGAMAEQWQAEDVEIILGPGINIKRSPLCGRNFEYYSEDPCVSGALGSAYVRAAQEKGTGTCLKHFLANNQEYRRRTESSEMDERTMREIYAAAFEQVVKEAKPWSIMAAYNKLDGVYATENADYLKKLLREEWGFDGAVISDWAAVHDRAAAIKGGCALTMPGDAAHDFQVVDAVRDGSLAEEDLDARCEEFLELVFRCEDARKKYAGTDYEKKEILEKAHQLARRVASESMVLLKNKNGILPFSPQAKVAVIGPFAKKPRYQGGGSSRVNAYQVLSLPEVTKDLKNVSYYDGMASDVEADPEKLKEAVTAAKEAEIAVIFAGVPPVMESEGFDRWTMKLPVCQNELIEAVCAVQPKTVVVLENGGAVEMPWVKAPAAILEAYLGGEAVNEAIWDVLTGEVNPSGHLAETFPLRLEDNPSYLFWPGEEDKVEYREGVFVGYRYYTSRDMKVRFPFGFGLSYTTFEYSNLTLDRDSYRAGERLTVSVNVKNTGEKAGKALVQLYVGASLGDTGVRRPVRELRSFEKVLLEPGEERTVTFQLEKRAFAHWDREVHNWRVAGGDYEVQIGTSAEEIVLRQLIKVEDEYIETGRKYNIMTPVCDAQKNPEGKAFLEKIMPKVNERISRLGKDKARQATPYQELMPKTMRMMTEPLQTLMRMLPDIPETEWQALFERMNQGR